MILKWALTSQESKITLLYWDFKDWEKIEVKEFKDVPHVRPIRFD